MEFDGEAVYALSVDERMTLTNMAIEAGAMNGIIAADKVTEDFLTDKVYAKVMKFSKVILMQSIRDKYII